MNAIYFKGNWENQLKKEWTKEMPFKTSQVRVLHYQKWFLVPVLILALKYALIRNKMSDFVQET
jgi:hypothetical protein